jgi:hypothetical protein
MADIKRTLAYFALFSYPPTAAQIHQFLRLECSQKECYRTLDVLTQTSQIIGDQNNPQRYVRAGNQDFFERFTVRSKQAELKRQVLDRFQRVQERIPWIQFAGISGSLAMSNTKQSDDIDLFIITQHQRLWTGRIATTVMTQLMGMKRHRLAKTAPDRICLNLFFDRTDLQIPIQKQTEYVAHEVLQLKPIFDRDQTYAAFINANSWVFQFFPQGDQYLDRRWYQDTNDTGSHTQPAPAPVVPLPDQPGQFSGAIASIVERLLKQIQLAIMRPHQTTERITETQLWFFPQDAEAGIQNALDRV